MKKIILLLIIGLFVASGFNTALVAKDRPYVTVYDGCNAKRISEAKYVRKYAWKKCRTYKRSIYVKVSRKRIIKNYKTRR